jgi:hypothetical protein
MSMQAPRKNEPESREAALRLIVNGLRPHFKDNGHPLPDNIRGNIGFTSDGRKGKPTGEVLFPDATGGFFELIVRCDQDEPESIGRVVAHLLLHVVTGPAHNMDFRDAANRLGFNLDDGLRNAKPGEKLQVRINEIVGNIPIPHTAVDFSKIRVKTKIADSQVADGKVRQVARMRKAECVIIDGEDRCGFTVRIARSWIDDVGPPHCPKHGAMKVHWEDGDKPEADPAAAPAGKAAP